VDAAAVAGEPSAAAAGCCIDALVWASKEARYHLNIVTTQTSYSRISRRTPVKYS